MSSQLRSSLIKFGFLFSILMVFILLMKGAFVPGSAQSEKAQGNDGRQLDDLVPKHLPIKIKIKAEKEAAFKDLKNSHWARDFELEVKNTGDRPIYFLSLVFSLPEIRMPDGNLYGFSLSYGRGDFITNATTVPNEKDVPIKPGETYVFKVPNHRISNWEKFQERDNIKQPKRIEIMFDHISFGDGTGFNSPGGRSFDDRGRRNQDQGQSGAPPCLSPPIDGVDEYLSEQPVTFAPANFLPAGSNSELYLPAAALSMETAEAAPDICCPGTSCSNIKVVLSRCYCSAPDPEINDMRFDTSTHARIQLDTAVTPIRELLSALIVAATFPCIA